jgi:enoyl-CoA hydratase
MADSELILIEKPSEGVGLIRLNRPKVLNALNSSVMSQIAAALITFSSDASVRVVVITGNERAFAAGADISEMSGKTEANVLQDAGSKNWQTIANFSKPLIAAVSGFVLGGGLELAMTCDMMIASETARFGQPEINLGIIPGAGGTQRLTRVVGKSLAMEMILNARMLNADEALRLGLVSKVVPVETYLDHALELAKQIAARAPIAVQMAKKSVNAAFELGLSKGLELERQSFAMLFGTLDQKEGMNAFLERRRAKWQGK